MLDAIKRENGLRWHDMARQVGRAGYEVGPDHIRRLGTGALTSTSPELGHAMERAFLLPLTVLLGPYQSALMPTQKAGITSQQEALVMAAKKARTLGLNLSGLENYSYLEEEARDLATAYPVTPLTELINPLVSLQEAVHDAVLNPRKHGDGSRLYGLCAITGGMLAKASHDLKDTHSAGVQVRTAISFADHIGHAELKAWLNGLMALVCYWDDRPRESLAATQRGLAASDTGSTALWLHASAARAWARLGNAEETITAVRRAETIADTMRAGDLDGYGGMLTFTAARARYYAADALSWLPGHDESERIATEAVEAYADPAQADWAFGDAAGAACDLAMARLHAGDIDGAGDAVAMVLELPREQRIGGIMKSVKRVGDALAAAPSSGVRDALQDELEAYLRSPMVMQP